MIGLNRGRLRAVLAVLAGIGFLVSGRLQAAGLHEFIASKCTDCHAGATPANQLDLDQLKLNLEDKENFARWVGVFDRVAKLEMPPKDGPEVTTAERKQFLSELSAVLLKADRERIARDGRATLRRLNRYEYESTLRDLLQLPYLEVKDFLPEDSLAFGFNKVGDALDVSHVQMSRYLTAAEYALRQGIVPKASQPESTKVKYYVAEQRAFRSRADGPKSRWTFPIVMLNLQPNVQAKDFNEAPLEDTSIAVVVSTYEPTEIRFDRFRAPVTGRYRLKFSGQSIWMSADYDKVSPGRRPEPITIYADRNPRILRKLGSFDFGPEPTECDLEVYLMAGETIRPDAARLFRSRPPHHQNPLRGPEGMPGVAYRWMEVEGPLFDEWPTATHRLLFEDLPISDREGSGGAGRRNESLTVAVQSSDPKTDAVRLLKKFLQHVYRRDVNDADVSPYVKLTHAALDSGYEFTDAMVAGYTAILSSPDFLYFQQKPGRLSDEALAERLSYFLWNTTPDAELKRLAMEKKLHDPQVLLQQANRLLDDPKSRRFVDAFADYWLDLRLTFASEPDATLYPDYQLDDLLIESMIEETQSYLVELIRRNSGIGSLVDSDFAMLNERLATHYGIPGVDGVKIRPVSVEGTVRGGLLTQASILKVTSNGTTTSPVVRGAWIMRRIIGKPPNPPPPSIPAVEPDTRGATTIREQLALHRSLDTCNACHKHIDPIGFAMESFDVMGAWRTKYRSLGSGEPVPGSGHNGIRNEYRLGPPVDPSGELEDGTKFADIRELKQCLLKQKEQLARNFISQLVTYATGAPVQYSDRAEVESILEETRSSDYGIRNLILKLVQSEMFLQK